VAGDELTKALLVEEVATPRAVAEALFASVTGGVPLLQALVDSGAATSDILSRYLARTEAPFLRQVVPVQDLVDRLPRGLCMRLLAIPVRRDAITGTIDVVVADPADPHPPNEIGFHLNAPVRAVRAPVAAIEEALRRLRMRSREDGPAERFREAAAHAAAIARAEQDAGRQRLHAPPEQAPIHAQPVYSVRDGRPYGDDDRMYDSRPRAEGTNRRPVSLPDVEPSLSHAMPSRTDLPPPPRLASARLVIDTDSVPPTPPPPQMRMRTPPWGTPIHAFTKPPTEPPGLGSEIPIPLTRKTFHPAMIRGGTERPHALVNPAAAGLGEGYAFDTTGLRDVVEKAAPPATDRAHGVGVALPAPPPPLGSFIPGPPPMPVMNKGAGFAAYAPHVQSQGSQSAGPTTHASPSLPFPEMGGILAALRSAGSRDEVLELVLTGARMVALKVALFVVKKGGYLGWVGTPEFADRAALQSILIPLDASSIFDRAVREDIYLGPIRYDEVHAPLLRVIRNPSRDVAVVPIRVSGRTAVIIMADELGDTMIGTRRLEALARAAGDAFTRIVRTRR
jgi:hypothetical protein